MDRTRAWRRHQRERIRNRRRHYFAVAWAWEQADLRRVGILSETPRPCSCIFCRNPWDKGMTPQSARAREALEHELLSDWLRLAEDTLSP